MSRYRPEYVLAIGNLLIGVGLALTGMMTGVVLLSVTVVIRTFGEMVTISFSQAYLRILALSWTVGRYQGLYGVAYPRTRPGPPEVDRNGHWTARWRRRVRDWPMDAVGAGRRGGSAVRLALPAAWVWHRHREVDAFECGLLVGGVTAVAGRAPGCEC